MRTTHKILILMVVCLLFMGSIGYAEGEAIDRSQFQPILVLEPINIEQGSPGGDFYLSFRIRNYGDHPAFNLSLDYKVEGTDGKEPFQFKDGEQALIEKIEGKESRNVTIGMKVDSNAQSKDYRLQFTLSCQNVFFDSGPTSVISVPIKVSYDLVAPQILVRKATILPEVPEPGEEFQVQIELDNISRVEARNLFVSLDGGDNFEVLDTINRKYFKTFPGGSKQTVTYTVRTKDGRKGNSLQVKMNYDYSGDKKEERVEAINLPLDRVLTSGGRTPWVIINKYTLSDKQVLGGNTVRLKLYIENTNPRPVSNVKISLGVIQVDGDKGGTVFSPVNSSNSFFVDMIPGQTTIEKGIDLYVDSNAAARTYIVPVKINYEDSTGNDLSVEELVNIPVTQESKLHVISVDHPPIAFIGQPFPISAEFVNVGKVALSNFIVMLEGDFNKENATYFVGNLDIGMSDYFQGMIFPDGEGELTGNLVFSYVDNSNREVQIEHPFTVEVQSMERDMMGEGPDHFGPEPGKPMPGGPGMGGKSVNGQRLLLFGITAVAIGEGVYILKKRSKEKSGEFFNE